NVVGVEDVNGDAKADLVLQFDHNGYRYWEARLSNGSSFQYIGNWAVTSTPDVNAVAVKDVNGDGKADLVLQFDHNGYRYWEARLSNGSSFQYIGNWAVTSTPDVNAVA